MTLTLKIGVKHGEGEVWIPGPTPPEQKETSRDVPAGALAENEDHTDTV